MNLGGPGLVDSYPDQALHDLSSLTATILSVPVATITFFDNESGCQYFRGQHGLPPEWNEWRELSFDGSFCQLVVKSNQVFFTNDARSDQRIEPNWLIDTLPIGAYLGAPVLGPDDMAIGTICAIDHAPREWTQSDIAIIEKLGHLASCELCLQHALHKSQALLNDHLRRTELHRNAPTMLHATDNNGMIVEVNEMWLEKLGFKRDDVVGFPVNMFIKHPGSHDQDCHETQALTASGRLLDILISTRTRKPDADDFQSPPATHYSVVTDITGHQKTIRRYQQLAASDPLTGLANRRAFEEEMKRVIARMEREDIRICLILVDVDHYKRFNDRYGHKSGDDFLSLIAQRLSDVVRRHDMVARIGGDEFAVIATGNLEDPAGDRQFDRLVERVMENMVEPADITPEPFAPSISIGYATLPFDRDFKWQQAARDTLFNQADAALYEAKNQGRRRAIRFSPGMTGGLLFRGDEKPGPL